MTVLTGIANKQEILEIRPSFLNLVAFVFNLKWLRWSFFISKLLLISNSHLNCYLACINYISF